MHISFLWGYNCICSIECDNNNSIDLYNMYWIRDSKVSGKKPALMMVVILKVYILFYLTIVMFFFSDK